MAPFSVGALDDGAVAVREVRDARVRGAELIVPRVTGGAGTFDRSCRRIGADAAAEIVRVTVE